MKSSQMKARLCKKPVQICEASGIDRPLKVFMRIDVAHFVHNLHKTETFQTVGAQAKHFYKCVIGTIMQISSYAEIKTIVKHLLILANYPIKGRLIDGTDLPTTESRKSLQRLIRTHDTSFLSCEESENKNENEGEVFLSEPQNKNIDASNIGWYLEMLKEIQLNAMLIDDSPSNLTSNVSINNYKCTDLNSYLEDLLSKLPLWSCVMCQYFHSPNVTANSCDVERQYSLIKSNIFHRYKLPVSAVVFIETLVKSINSVTTLTTIMMKQRALQETPEHQQVNSISSKYLNFLGSFFSTKIVFTKEFHFCFYSYVFFTLYIAAAR